VRGAIIAGGSMSEALVDRVREWGHVEPPAMIAHGLTETVRGPNVMPSCARMPAETRRSFTPEAFIPAGDSNVIDEDGNAELDDVCVIGVPQDILGEPVCARVVPDEGAVTTGEEVEDFARDTVADYTTPSS